MTGCAAINCSNRVCKAEINHAKGLTFHRFPFSKPKLLEKWLANMRRVDSAGNPWRPSKAQRICSAHFAPECFDRTGQTVRLRRDAVPTVFNIPGHLQKTVWSRNKRRPRKKAAPIEQDDISLQPTSQTEAMVSEHHYNNLNSPLHLKRQLEQREQKVTELRKNSKLEKAEQRQLTDKVIRLSSVIDSLKARRLISDNCDELL